MKRILGLIAALVALFAYGPRPAYAVEWDTAVFPGNCTKQFHITGTSSSYQAAYSNLVRKFGADSVFRFSDYTTLDTIEGNITSGEVACLLFYPGTYTFTDAWTVAKPVQIMSATGNVDDVNLDGDTNNVDILIFADGSDGSSVRNVRFTLDNATSSEEDAVTIQSGADGVTVENCNFIGSASSSTDAQGVTIAANRCRVTGCYFGDVATSSGAISVTGTDNILRANVFYGTKASQVGILFTAGSRTIVDRNRIALTGASSDIGLSTTSTATNCIASDNAIYATDPISAGTNGTLVMFGNYNNVAVSTTTAAPLWIGD